MVVFLNENIYCRMGIEILSFTIKDVYDNVTYLQVTCMINFYYQKWYLPSFYRCENRRIGNKKKQEFYNWHFLTSLSPPQSLGKAQTAAVKRDAEIGVAQVFLQNQPWYYALALSSLASHCFLVYLLMSLWDCINTLGKIFQILFRLRPQDKYRRTWASFLNVEC